MTDDQGVHFPSGGSSATGQAVWAHAVRLADPDLAARIDASRRWRKEYVDAVVAHTAAAARSPETAVDIARRGLDELGRRLRFRRDGALTSVAEAVSDGKDDLRPATVRGTGEQVRELVLPYRGQELRGDALRRQLEAWTARGTVEPSCAAAIGRVVDDPAMLDLSDRAFALLGAGAEMGPLRPLLQWGAHVVAVDVPQDAVWQRILETARTGAGTLTHPVGGVDLLTQAPEAGAFLRAAAPDLPMTIGSYAYADGAKHVLVAHASDAVVDLLLRERPGTGYAELATPTDAFAVPHAVVDESVRRWHGRGWRRVAQGPVRLAARGALYAPAYATTVRRDDGTTVGVADVLIPQQGPNYTLAKRLQRWRATAAHADGHPVSANVAPATRTRSVTKNKLLAAAYAGAGRFGVEVFAPETSRVLMAALLVHDLRGSATPPRHPDDLFSDGAAHGGLWRSAYAPRSVLTLAAVMGLPGTLARR